jgi:hypothetical protein
MVIKGVRKNVVIICLSALCLAACTSQNVTHFVGQAIADGADTQVAYGPQQCMHLRSKCIHGEFQEWQTSKKEPGCSCKEL